jgi:hypothetical protein
VVEIYGLSTSPCEGLSGKKLIGELQSRNRRLSDIELAAFWRATGRWAWEKSRANIDLEFATEARQEAGNVNQLPRHPQLKIGLVGGICG